MALRRRSFFFSAAALAGASCASTSERAAGIVALPERSLSYAPLLLALRNGLFGSPPLRAAPLLVTGGLHVAAAVMDGSADAGALAAADALRALAAGAPLVAFGALTRRLGGQLVVATNSDAPRDVNALLRGQWRGVPLGLHAGADGTEQAMRYWLAAAGAPRAATELLAEDPSLGEPRWVSYGTDSALVAALQDGRIAAFLGRSLAAAEASVLGIGAVAANLSDGTAAPDVAAALPKVLIARRDRVSDPETVARLLGPLARGCARAAQVLSGPEGPAAAGRALPEIDSLYLQSALRLDAPSPSASIFATAGRPEPGALERLAQLTASAVGDAAAAASQLWTDRVLSA